MIEGGFVVPGVKNTRLIGMHSYSLAEVNLDGKKNII